MVVKSFDLFCWYGIVVCYWDCGGIVEWVELIKNVIDREWFKLRVDFEE